MSSRDRFSKSNVEWQANRRQVRADEQAAVLKAKQEACEHEWGRLEGPNPHGDPWQTCAACGKERTARPPTSRGRTTPMEVTVAGQVHTLPMAGQLPNRVGFEAGDVVIHKASHTRYIVAGLVMGADGKVRVRMRARLDSGVPKLVSQDLAADCIQKVDLRDCQHQWASPVSTTTRTCMLCGCVEHVLEHVWRFCASAYDERGWEPPK